jgi:hydroxymethylpyrimidine/phosphomethylpyrimidine kinase
MRPDAQRLAEAVARLEACREFALLVPEVRVNVVYLPPGADAAEQVLAVEGRITVVAGMPKAAGPVRAGVSDHMARLIVEARRYDPSIRAGLDFRWNEAISAFVERYGREHGLAIGCIDRTTEPREYIGRDRSSIPWKVTKLVETTGGIPPLFYETRGWGKEPLFFAVHQDPVELAERACDIARGFAADGR